MRRRRRRFFFIPLALLLQDIPGKQLKSDLDCLGALRLEALLLGGGGGTRDAERALSIFFNSLSFRKTITILILSCFIIPCFVSLSGSASTLFNAAFNSDIDAFK